MDYRIRLTVFKFLDLLPKTVGERMYHLFQKLLQSTRISNSIVSHKRTLIKISKILQKMGLSFNDKSILEIGSGWAPFTPYLLLNEFKVKKVYTYDINEHYSRSKVVELNQYFTKEYSIFIPNLNRIDNRIKYYPNSDLSVESPEEMVDVIISRNVLEHVPKNEIINMHLNLIRSLTPGGIVVHQISPSDHRSYTDSKLSLWDFLQYSEAEWKSQMTSFDYHNRLRLPQYLEIFEASGFEIAYCSYESNRNGLKMPPKIHEDFSGFSFEELTAGNIIVILRPILQKISNL